MEEEGDPKREEGKDAGEDRELANTYSRTMMSAKLLRLQTTEDGQAGFGAEQLKVVLNAFFKVMEKNIEENKQQQQQCFLKQQPRKSF